MTGPVLHTSPLGFPWQPPDPFLACMHHDDAYPAGNDALGPKASLAGRHIGMDFEGKDGWRMYHGATVPGFPQHPHRGFETVTIVRRGLIDHSDSLGAAARFGGGDAQWITAGKGICHSEMFPLLERDKGNPVELFQIWLNLPRVDKLADPHFSMLWAEQIPHVAHTDDAGRTTEVTLFAGSYGGKTPPPPPPKSWASRAEADVAIWTLKLAPGARFPLPAAHATSNRTLFFFRGGSLLVGGQRVPGGMAIHLQPDAAVVLENGPDVAELLMLQGRPIGEPVAQHGPFVMTTRAEIQQAFFDYQRTQFGGWPWERDDPVHAREKGRWAKFVDGHEESPR